MTKEKDEKTSNNYIVLLRNRIRDLEQEKNTNLKQIAEKGKLPYTTLKSFMNGISSNPGAIQIIKICDGLNISVKEFFDFEPFNIQPSDRLKEQNKTILEEFDLTEDQLRNLLKVLKEK